MFMSVRSNENRDGFPAPWQFHVSLFRIVCHCLGLEALQFLSHSIWSNNLNVLVRLARF